MNQPGTEPTIGDIVWGYSLDTHSITYGKIEYTRGYFGNLRMYIAKSGTPLIIPADIVAFNLGHLREKVIEYINQNFDQLIENETR
jgi:hypothetical protein